MHPGIQIVDSESGETLAGSGHQSRRGMASLTKMMTCHMVLELAKLNPDILHETIQVSDRAASVPKTLNPKP
jgi:D-alanyl-D-alanine carboxypeptidase